MPTGAGAASARSSSMPSAAAWRSRPTISCSCSPGRIETMPMSHPSAPEMLAVIREYLEATILPELRDDKWFNVKVAANMLATVERELRLGPAADAAEIARLE